MCKFKVGDKIKILDVNVIAYGGFSYFDGMETKIFKIDNGYIYTLDAKGKEGVCISLEEVEKGAIKLIKNKKNKERIKSLEKRVEEQQNEINELKVLVHQLRDNTTIVVKEDIKSNNELRAEIIEKAKVFVKINSTLSHRNVETTKLINGNRLVSVYFNYSEKIEFVVNEEKRTVVALIKGLNSNTLFHIGIAKCMPSDVFNEHIGKAIALGRALNIDVSEFENAVLPDSIVLGMFIKDKNSNFFDASGTVCKLKKGSFGSDGYENENGEWNSFEYSEIIDDTNAIYNEVK